MATNDAASWIWTLWVLAAADYLIALIAWVAYGANPALLLLLGIAVICFVASFAFAKEAKRFHDIRAIMRNPVLFGDESKDA